MGINTLLSHFFLYPFDAITLTGGVTQLLSQIELMEFEQQITFLRDAVVNAGAEPKSGAQI